MSIPAKTIHEDEFFYGHKACAGCGGSLAVRIALKVLGERSVAVLPAGCMSAVGFNFPQLCFGNNAIISTFAGTASMLTGIEAGLRAQGITDFHAVGLPETAVQPILEYRRFPEQLTAMTIYYISATTTKPT